MAKSGFPKISCCVAKCMTLLTPRRATIAVAIIINKIIGAYFGLMFKEFWVNVK